LRQEVGKQAAVINQLIVDLPDQLEDKYPRLETRIGHTYPQLIVGFVLGMIIAVIL
jgi:acid phosphatase family membrane protein YuiD